MMSLLRLAFKFVFHTAPEGVNTNIEKFKPALDVVKRLVHCHYDNTTMQYIFAFRQRT